MEHRSYLKIRAILFGVSLCLGISLLLSGSQAIQGQRPAQTKAQRLAVRTDMLVSPEWLAGHLGDKNLVVLHVARERAHYDEGHIPGARFLAWGEITATRAGVPNELPPVAELQKEFERLGVSNRGRIVLYGDNIGLSAARAYFTLDYLGHGERAALLDGGLEKWRAERREVSTAAVTTKPQLFTPNVKPGVVTALDVVRDLSWVATNLSSPGVALVNARPAEEYTGSKPGEGVTRGGHIPGAVNVFWMQNLVSRENPVMRPAAELRKLYEAVGAEGDKQVVTYCRTGGQASHAYFTAKYLGYDVVMYDGSFFEWSKTAGTQVVTGERPK
jgi:thiosulfate/3-mercaptopyruvate sulfurtransferase